MGINISLDNIKASGNTRVLNNTTIRGNGDVDINLQNLELEDQVEILENLEIDSILSELEKKAAQLDKNTNEYFKIKEILKGNQWQKKNVCQLMAKHLSEFSQGVLASVVANFLTSR